MIVLIPVWLVLFLAAFRVLARCAWFLLCLLVELIVIIACTLGTLVAVSYRWGRCRANPFYETLREIRKLPELQFRRFRRTVPR